MPNKRIVGPTHNANTEYRNGQTSDGIAVGYRTSQPRTPTRLGQQPASVYATTRPTHSEPSMQANMYGGARSGYGRRSSRHPAFPVLETDEFDLMLPSLSQGTRLHLEGCQRGSIQGMLGEHRRIFQLDAQTGPFFIGASGKWHHRRQRHRKRHRKCRCISEFQGRVSGPPAGLKRRFWPVSGPYRR